MAVDDEWRRRLAREMERRGLNMKQLSERARLGETAIRDILQGHSKSPRGKTLGAIAEALGMSVGELMDGAASTAQKIKVLGSVTSSEEWAPLPKRAKAADTTFGVEGEAIAVTVMDDAMAPVFRRGDLLIGVRQQVSAADNLVGLDCIVMTNDGRGMIKFLARGERGTFTLRSYSPTTEDITNVRLSWVAPIAWIKRRQ